MPKETEKLQNSNKAKSTRILKRFEEARRKRVASGKDAKWKELDAFDRGEQWQVAGDKLPPWVPKPVTNFVHLVKTTKKAALAVENPTGKIYPQGPSDQELSDKLQKVYMYEWDRVKLRKYVREAIDTGKLLGTAIVQLYYDESDGVQGPSESLYEGQIKAMQIDPANFYPDPNAFSLEDCEFVHIVKRKPLSFLKSHPEFKDKAAQVEARELSNQEKGEIYNRHYDSERKDKMIDFHEHYEKIPNEEVGGYTYKVTYMAGDVYLTEKNIRPNRYPFAVYYDFKQRQDFWGMSTCEYILDNQKLINKVESVIALIGTLLQNPQKVVHKQSGINPKEASKYGDAPGHTYQSNIDPRLAIHWLQPPQIPQALFSLAEQAKQNIREITGLTESYMGQSVGSLQTSSGVDSLIERSTMRDRDQMYDLELFIEDLSKLLIGFISEYYTEERYMRVIDEQTQDATFETFRGSDFKDLAFDIKLNVSAKAPMSRARQQQEMEKLITLQGQMQYDPPIITPQEYMKYSDFQDSDMIIKRMNLDETQSNIGILTETIQMMTEAINEGIAPEQAGEMGIEMVQQRIANRQANVGSTSENAGEIQARQSGPVQV